MTSRQIKKVQCLAIIVALLLPSRGAMAADRLAEEFASPPVESRAWCYWWWLNGNASKEGISRDFEEMRKQGISGALLFDAGEAGADVPRGPKFMSDDWRELYKHAVREADRCGIALGVNLCSGWNAGGLWVTHEHAAKKLVSAETVVKGPGRVTVALPKPAAAQGFYQDIAVLAAPIPDSAAAGGKLTASSQYQHYGPALAEDGDDESRWVSNGGRAGMGPTPEKPEFLRFDFAVPYAAAGLFLRPYSDCAPKDVEVQCSDDGETFRPLKRLTLQPRDAVTIAFDETRAKHFRAVFLTSYPYQGGNWNVQVAEIALLAKGQEPPRRGWDRSRTAEVTKFVDANGQLAWDAPAGIWRVLRLGCTLHGNRIKCVGSGPTGLEIDTMSAEAMDAHFAATGAKLVADAGPLAGKSLQYFHVDSWELGQPTWTPKMREEFRRRRSYDPLLWLPAVLGQAVDSAEATSRFMQDYRRTAADLVAENYYGRLEELSRKGGLRGTHPESGGPFFTHWIDALQCMGRTAIPMGEFWRRNYEPAGDITHDHNPSLKQAASAAHIYGKPLCQAEAFTSMNACDWTAEPWIFKDVGDEAFCEGLTRNVLCFWVHQPRLDAKPGFQWAHVGTHFDCNITWWPMAAGWLTYLARCQHMLRQGLFVADFAYLQDEAVPGFIAKRREQLPARPAGFDYDAINAEVLLTRASAKAGRLALPDGMSYRYLVLPQQPGAILAPATLEKVNELAEAGVTVIGPKALASSVPKLREGSLDDVTRADGLAPDIEFLSPSEKARFDWIHRRDGGTEIYFVCNQTAAAASATVAFRVAGKRPELWDAITGSVRDLPDYREQGGRTLVPLQFAPRESWFVVFRTKGRESARAEGKNFRALKPAQEIAGAWDVQLDPKWFYPDGGTGGKVRFEQLADWTKRPEVAVQHYSGVAVYRKVFDFAGGLGNAGTAHSPLYLNLGVVKNVARVRVNGRDLGTVWTAPWQAAMPEGLLKEKGNELIIEVANLWPNRLIGDATLPEGERRTATNVRTYDTMKSGTYGCRRCDERRKTGKPAELLPAGLLGPVTLMQEE
jgi:hypothetical protein